MKNKRHQNHTNHTTNNSNVWMAVAQVCIAIGKAINAYYSEKR